MIIAHAPQQCHCPAGFPRGSLAAPPQSVTTIVIIIIIIIIIISFT